MFTLVEKTSSGMLEADAKELFLHLLTALEHIHSMGVCHRDLKPENIVVEGTDPGKQILRIVDFGCATDDITKDSSPTDVKYQYHQKYTGTLNYMAPEM